VLGREVDDLAEKLLVDVAEAIGWDDGKRIRALRPVERADDLAQHGVVEGEAQRELVGRFLAAFFGSEVEKAGAVAKVGALEDLAEARIDFPAGGEAEELAVGLDAAILGDAEEDDTVEDALDGEVEIALGEGAVSQREVFGEVRLAEALSFSRGRWRVS
jgi:hypothetical protein